MHLGIDMSERDKPTLTKKNTVTAVLYDTCYSSSQEHISVYFNDHQHAGSQIGLSGRVAKRKQ